jgi:iron(III) transport system ATP-binding protein
MRFELKRLQRELKITTVYVTHDQSEALALSHKIAVMNAGRIQQIGTPRDIYERPQTTFVADFVGTTNFVDGDVLGADTEAGYFRIRTGLGTLRAISAEALTTGARVVLSVRPEDVGLSETEPDGEVNVLSGTVDQKVFLGEALDWQVKVGERVVLARSHPSIRTPIGRRTWLRIEPSKCVALPVGADGAPA